MIGQTRLRDRLLASAKAQDSRTNQVRGRARYFMKGPRRESHDLAEQEPGQALEARVQRVCDR